MSKLIPIIWSPGYGGGWSTWNSNSPACVHDRDVARIITEYGVHGDDDGVFILKSYSEHHALVREAALRNHGEGFFVSEDRLHVAWVDPGTPFYISESDGAEVLILPKQMGRAGESLPDLRFHY